MMKKIYTRSQQLRAIVVVMIATLMALMFGGILVAATPATKAVKTGPVVPKPKIADFEGKNTPIQFGWIAVTDTIMKGKSKATASIASNGADSTKQSLKIEGSVIKAENPFVMFAGLATRFDGGKTTYDVTSFTGIKFWAKGDGNTYRIDFPTAAVKDYMYYSFSFTPPTGTWKEYKVPFAGFQQMPYGQKVPWTGTDVQGVEFYTVGGPVDKFTLQVDELAFYK